MQLHRFSGGEFPRGQWDQALEFETIWITLPHVSSKTAMVMVSWVAGGWVNRTPSATSRSYSDCASLTVKAVNGIPSATNALRNGPTAGWLGSGGSDVLLGGDGNDVIAGDADNDTISGGSGDDSLNGGSETNSISGDFGTDTCLLAQTVSACEVTEATTAQSLVPVGFDVDDSVTAIFRSTVGLNKFGGFYENSSGQLILLVAGPIDAALQTLAQNLVSNLGLTKPLVIREAAFTEQQLQTSKAAIAALFKSNTPIGGREIVSYGLTGDETRVSVKLLNATEADIVNAASSWPGIVFETSQGFQTIGRYDDSAPFTGGSYIALRAGNGAQCTLATTVFMAGSPGFYLSADHCSPSATGSTVFNGLKDSRGTTPVGTVVARAKDLAGLDILVIQASPDCNSTCAVNSRVWTGSDPQTFNYIDDYYIGKGRVDGWCVSGAASGREVCGFKFKEFLDGYNGRNKATGVKTPYNGGMYLSAGPQGNVTGGDSGSPVYRWENGRMIFGGVASSINDDGLVVVPMWEIFKSTTVRPAGAQRVVSVAVRQTQFPNFQAVATFNDGSSRDVTASAVWYTIDGLTGSTNTAWKVSDTPGSKGFVYYNDNIDLASRATIVKASFGGVFSQQSPLIGGFRRMLPYPSDFSIGQEWQFTAEFEYPDPRIQPVTNFLAALNYPYGGLVNVTTTGFWKSSNPSAIVVDNVFTKGYSRAVGPAANPVLITGSFVVPERPDTIFTQYASVTVGASGARAITPSPSPVATSGSADSAGT
jgi:hypothetical protein